MKSNLKTHLRENNSDSQSHLQENEQKFSDQCLKVLKILNRGVKLTVASAMEHGISSLPRRILDLRERNGIKNIKDEWVRNGDGKRLYKIWYIEGLRKPTKKQTTEKHSQTIIQEPLFN